MIDSLARIWKGEAVVTSSDALFAEQVEGF
jgi:hypothetical protein